MSDVVLVGEYTNEDGPYAASPATFAKEHDMKTMTAVPILAFSVTRFVREKSLPSDTGSRILVTS